MTSREQKNSSRQRHTATGAGEPTQVCAPVPAVALIRYPAAQAEQSTAEFVSHKVPPEPVATVGVPPGQVQMFADQRTKEL